MRLSEISKNLLIIFNTDAKQSFATTHSNFSVEIKDKVDRLKVLRDICTLIGYMIDTLGKTTLSVYKKFAPKSSTDTIACQCLLVTTKKYFVIG